MIPKIPQNQNLSAQIVCPSPKVWVFDDKRLHWASVVRSLTEQVNRKQSCVKDLQIKHWTTSIRNSRNLQFYRVCSSCFNENSKANTLMSCLTSSPFTFECVKQDFGHLPNKSLLKQGKLLLLLIFSLFSSEVCSTKHWLSQVHTYMAETKKKRQTKRPQNAYLKSNYAENLLKTALLGP